MRADRLVFLDLAHEILRCLTFQVAHVSDIVKLRGTVLEIALLVGYSLLAFCSLDKRELPVAELLQPLVP